nr:olfactory receptor 2A1/2A42-like [Anolis sagrei ordinatus]
MTNETFVTEFLLLGLARSLTIRLLLFGLFSTAYAITLAGNAIILMLICLDSRLHTPMYFFLSNLACVDICYTSSTVPQMLVNLQSPSKPISLASCAVQMYVFLILATTECFLLAVMAYDRYVAVCHPLHYTSIMNKQVCINLAAASWTSGLILPVAHMVLTWQLPFCGPNLIDHFFCEIPALLKLACTDTYIVEKVTSVGCIFTLLIPIAFIIMTYIFIISSILKIQSVQSQHKAFSTCASHMTVVALFYGTAIYMYMRPESSHSPGQDKIISIFYSIVIPLFNPIIYSLKNKDVKGAWIKILQRCQHPALLWPIKSSAVASF